MNRKDCFGYHALRHLQLKPLKLKGLGGFFVPQKQNDPIGGLDCFGLKALRFQSNKRPMARKAQITAKVLKISNPQGWLVRLYQGKGRKPYQKYFADEQKAIKHAGKLNENIPMEGAAGVVFDAVARADYAAAKQELPAGVSLLEAAKFYTEHKRQRITVASNWDDAVFALIEAREQANRAVVAPQLTLAASTACAFFNTKRGLPERLHRILQCKIAGRVPQP